MSLLSFPFVSSHRERQLQDLLIAHADALISGSLDLESLLAPYDQELRDQVGDLLDLADRLSRSLTEINPSEQFISRLHQQLVLADAEFWGHRTWWGRIRDLPPRTQWAAASIGGATLTAGVVLIASRTLPEVWNFWRSRRTSIA